MNERIKELAEQAGFIIENGKIYANECFHEITKDLEMIAELIVRECAEVAADHDALDIYEEIRERFGVES